MGEGGRAALELRPAWRRGDPALERDAVGFWERLRLLPPQVDPQAHARNLCLVAYRGGAVAAVSAATLEYDRHLRARLAVFRCAVDPVERQGPVVAQLAEGSRLVLADWARANPQEKVKGMGAVNEMAGFDLMKRNPVWRYKGLRLVLVRWTPEGHPVRVAWFPGARIEPPGQGLGPSA